LLDGTGADDEEDSCEGVPDVAVVADEVPDAVAAVAEAPAQDRCARR
jgi:hypothetical protein